MIKWVVRFAFITALLGLMGTVAIIVRIHRKQEDAKAIKSEKKADTVVTTIKSDSEILKSVPADTASATKPVVVEKKDTVPAISTNDKIMDEKVTDTVVAKTENNRKAIKKDEVTTAVKPNIVKKQQKETLLNRDELKQLMRHIYQTKLKNHIISNCVQIYITSESPKKKTFSQVGKYLKSRNFSIVGREVVEKQIRGIKITPIGECIRVTIGVF